MRHYLLHLLAQIIATTIAQGATQTKQKVLGIVAIILFDELQQSQNLGLQVVRVALLDCVHLALANARRSAQSSPIATQFLGYFLKDHRSFVIRKSSCGGIVLDCWWRHSGS